jgi:predicted HD phosphohydrolase
MLFSLKIRCEDIENVLALLTGKRFVCDVKQNDGFFNNIAQATQHTTLKTLRYYSPQK